MFKLSIKGFYSEDCVSGDAPLEDDGYTRDLFVFECGCRMERFTNAGEQPVDYYCIDQDAPNNGAYGWEWYETCPSHKEEFYAPVTAN